ncbi:BlaI/MecI/CopY family transcriptional regulator [Streptomyces sp. NPDC054883]
MLWSTDEPLTARQVRERLPGGLAYTTVLTILSRLHEKGMLLRHREGRGYADGGRSGRRARSAGDQRHAAPHRPGGDGRGCPSTSARSTGRAASHRAKPAPRGGRAATGPLLCQPDQRRVRQR